MKLSRNTRFIALLGNASSVTRDMYIQIDSEPELQTKLKEAYRLLIQSIEILEAQQAEMVDNLRSIKNV